MYITPQEWALYFRGIMPPPSVKKISGIFFFTNIKVYILRMDKKVFLVILGNICDKLTFSSQNVCILGRCYDFPKNFEFFVRNMYKPLEISTWQFFWAQIFVLGQLSGSSWKKRFFLYVSSFFLEGWVHFFFLGPAGLTKLILGPSGTNRPQIWVPVS